MTLLIDFETSMHLQQALLSSSNDTANAINYLLNRWAAFTRFLDDGPVCQQQRRRTGPARRGGFAGSDADGHRAAAYTLVATCKMNDVDPEAWLAGVLTRLPDSPANKVPAAALELEGEPAAQGRRCRLSDLHRKIAPRWGAGRVRTRLRPWLRIQRALLDRVLST